MTPEIKNTEYFKSLVESETFLTVMYDGEFERIIAEISRVTDAVIFIYDQGTILSVSSDIYMEEEDLKILNDAMNEVLRLNNKYNRRFEEPTD